MPDIVDELAAAYERHARALPADLRETIPRGIAELQRLRRESPLGPPGDLDDVVSRVLERVAAKQETQRPPGAQRITADELRTILLDELTTE